MGSDCLGAMNVLGEGYKCDQEAQHSGPCGCTGAIWVSGVEAD